MNYHFEKDEHIEMVKNGIDECKEKLGKNKKILEYMESNKLKRYLND